MLEKEAINQIEGLYKKLDQCHAEARKRLGRALTYAEKVLFSHLAEWPTEALVRGKGFINMKPDRVAMQDATAQMAILQFSTAGKEAVDVPTTIHCDHLINAYKGAKSDLLSAVNENEEVYNFLSSSAKRYGMGFWKPGAGIIHQVVLEQYAFPGGMMIGTDSHTPNAGGLGMIAIGVGGADAVDVMVGEPWGFNTPKLIGVNLTGKMSGWTSAKDVILKVAALLTVKGGTGKIVEYFGPGTETISCTGKATITNMGAELGATTSIFPYDRRMGDYLRKTERSDVAALADKYSQYLKADPEIVNDPKKYYDEVLEIDLSKLEPGWVGPHTPDLYRKASDMKAAVIKEGYPDHISVALIGSCTNSSYEDISRSASIAKQATERGLKLKSSFMVTPGSEQIFNTIERDGQLKLLTDAGATVLSNACGPCIGQWTRDDVKKGEKNTIVTSYNRNFAKRNDGNAETNCFIGSPELVTAVAFSGQLSFNPMTDSLTDSKGQKFMFTEPVGDELPKAGYVKGLSGYIAPIDDLNERRKMKMVIDPKSDRLEVLEPFAAWDGKDFSDLTVLVKAKGKCTTDHISQAGPWLKYRGHLANISDNMLIGAINYFTAETGKGTNVITGEKGISFPEIAKSYRNKGIGWVVVGDENYGEGSSREHAAMSPRFLGAKAVIVKSFARIHETNLKKQGVLPLRFENPADYDCIGENDRISISGLVGIKPGSKITVTAKGSDGKEKSFTAIHTMTDEQINWFKAGSALNLIRLNQKKAG
ncbi:MAG: aconitate hydratase [bacterium]|nr:aconitate hydratase [bacterium]